MTKHPLVFLLFLLAGPVAAQTSTPDSARTATPGAAARPLLLKLGTGLTRGFGWGGYGGLTLPVVLGAEVVLRPGWNLSANSLSSFYVGGNRVADVPIGLRELGGELGLRRYYHQAKRQAKGRAHGPFTGNYVGLHATSNWFYYRQAGSAHLDYDYSSLTAVWGLQRRLGGHGLLDAYVGGGLANPRRTGDYDALSGRYELVRFPLQLLPELGLKLSLVY